MISFLAGFCLEAQGEDNLPFEDVWCQDSRVP